MSINNAHEGSGDFRNQHQVHSAHGNHAQEPIVKTVPEALRSALPDYDIPLKSLDALALLEIQDQDRLLAKLIDGLDQECPVRSTYRSMATKQKERGIRGMKRSADKLSSLDNQVDHEPKVIRIREGSPNWKSTEGCIAVIWLVVFIALFGIEFFTASNFAMTTGLAFVNTWGEALSMSTIFVAGAFLLTRKVVLVSEGLGRRRFMASLLWGGLGVAWTAALSYAYAMGSVHDGGNLLEATKLPIPMNNLMCLAVATLIPTLVEAERNLEIAYARLFEYGETHDQAVKKAIEHATQQQPFVEKKVDSNRDKYIDAVELLSRLDGDRDAKLAEARSYLALQVKKFTLSNSLEELEENASEIDRQRRKLEHKLDRFG